jgi:hypothetical protein
MTAQLRAIDRIMRICTTPALDDRSLRVAILNEIRPVVAFDAFVWLLTDRSARGEHPTSVWGSYRACPNCGG